MWKLNAQLNKVHTSTIPPEISISENCPSENPETIIESPLNDYESWMIFISSVIPPTPHKIWTVLKDETITSWLVRVFFKN